MKMAKRRGHCPRFTWFAAEDRNRHLIAMHWQRFLAGTQANGVSEEVAKKIFNNVNGHYIFSRSHSHAFSITAYHAA